MIAIINDHIGSQDSFEDSRDLAAFERFTYRREREFPVRSQSSRTRAKMRGRGSVAARHKSAAYNGVNRRGLGKYWR